MIETPLEASRATGIDRAGHSEHTAAPVEVDRVSRTFKRGHRPAVQALADVSLQAGDGEVVAVVPDCTGSQIGEMDR